MRKLNRSLQAGQNLIEFILLFPVLFLILMGIFDLGRVVFYYSTLTNAAREGARFGAVEPDNVGGIKDAVCGLAMGLDLGCPNPASGVLNITRADNYIEIRITYKFPLITPVISSFFELDENGKFTIHTQSRMRIEG